VIRASGNGRPVFTSARITWVRARMSERSPRLMDPRACWRVRTGTGQIPRTSSYGAAGVAVPGLSASLRSERDLRRTKQYPSVPATKRTLPSPGPGAQRHLVDKRRGQQVVPTSPRPAGARRPQRHCRHPARAFMLWSCARACVGKASSLLQVLFF
jgi:hypothetical protein